MKSNSDPNFDFADINQNHSRDYTYYATDDDHLSEGKADANFNVRQCLDFEIYEEICEDSFSSFLSYTENQLKLY